jgi:hypothetical protein
MANPEDDNFVDDKLASMREPDNASPNLARGRTLILARMGVTPRRWAWKLATVAAVLLLLLARPTAKAIAKTGTFSYSTMHDVLLELHVELYQFHRLLWGLFH